MFTINMKYIAPVTILITYLKHLCSSFPKAQGGLRYLIRNIPKYNLDAYAHYNIVMNTNQNC